MSNLATLLAALPDPDRRRELSKLSARELSALEWSWPVWARAEQLPPPGDWRTWAIIAGRGFGKSRTAAEATRAEVESGRRHSIALIAPTADTARRDMVRALLDVSPPWFRPSHEPSQRRLVWPNGALGHVLTAEEPDRLRGLNLDFLWADEFSSWANQAETWSNAQFALRVAGPLGDAPRGIVSTTPKPSELLKQLLADPGTVLTRGRTFDNAANLDPSALAALQTKFAGTSLGRQELEGELLLEAEGALWSRPMLEACRVPFDHERQFKRVIVAVDPAGGTGRGSTETGVIVAGLGHDGHGYIVRDLSGKHSPERWAYAAVNAYHDHRADRIVAEKNFGGQMVESTIRSVAPSVPVRMVQASRGKAVRAEPVVALFEQHRVHLVGFHRELEDQLCSWDPLGSGPSPDRLDAMVWAITDLMLGAPPSRPARRIHLPFMAR